MDEAPDPIYVHDSHGRVAYLNRAARDLLGVREGTVATPGGGALATSVAALSGTALGDVHTWEGTLPRADTSVCSVETRARKLALPDGSWCAVSVARDVTERKRLEALMRHQALHDPLTGLPNRRLFAERLDHALAHARRVGRSVAVLYLDLDDFKAVNDAYGHAVGDAALARVASILRTTVRETDALSRHGGDEFLVALADLEAPSTAARVAQRILARLRAPLVVRGHTLSLGASVGVALFPLDGEAADELVDRADRALEGAKRGGKGGVIFHCPELACAVAHAGSLEAFLRTALQRDAIELVFQPRVHLGTGALMGIEALMRIQGDAGLIPALEFIQVAEDTGLVVPLGRRALHAACAQLAAWRAAGVARECPVTVNATPRELCSAGYLDFVEGALRETGLDASDLLLEVEAAGLDTPAARQTALVLRDLGDRGVRLCLDHLLWGHAALEHAEEWPLAAATLDQRLLRHARDTRGNGAVLRALVGLCHDLGMTVFSAGVDDPTIPGWAREVGCDGIQGQCYGEPVSASVFAERLRAQPSEA